MKRGEIYRVNLSSPVGSEQGGTRPVLVIQNDVGNKFSTTVIVAAITSKLNKSYLPTHVVVNPDCKNKLTGTSLVLLEQLRTIDKKRFINKIGTLSDEDLSKVNDAILISLSLKDMPRQSVS